jgi:hypothetical protein
MIFRRIAMNIRVFLLGPLRGRKIKAHIFVDFDIILILRTCGIYSNPWRISLGPISTGMRGTRQKDKGVYIC